MFIDEIKLHLKAGKGGDGVERWLHEKGKDKGGPSGGNGGKGGDVFALAVRDLGILSAYRDVKVFEAGPGGDGMKNVWHGSDGEDIEIKFPIGSRITNLTTGHIFELVEDGQRLKLLTGGRGGLGNEHFKSSTNVRPKEFTLGVEGEESDFHIELELVVDYGLIGLPNAGKSSLLNTITRARAKVGAFPFTTLEPNLGDLYGVIIGDIPGLIEGASMGKGLGHKFLRHIKRTKGIIHCISAEETDPLATYNVIRNELELYNKDIINKPEVILLTKTDMITPEEKDKKLAILKTLGKPTFAISIIDDESIKSLKDFLTQQVSQK